MAPSKGPGLKQLGNEKALKVYAIAVCGLVVLVVTSRWLRAACNKTLHPWPSSKLQDSACKVVLLVFHKLEKRIKWKWLGQPSLGLLILLGILLAVNIVLCSQFVSIYRVNFIASRFGWMAIANMAMCVFFASRNSPLAFLAIISHSQLNRLHQILGYSTAFLVLQHAIFYTIHFGRQDRWEKLTEVTNIEGIGAGAAMIILLMGSIRHWNYEVFYISHITSFAFVLALTGLHRPDWVKKVPAAMVLITFIWIIDRGMRTAKMAYNLIDNEATLYMLPHGGVRLLLRKPREKDALPGSYCFLWIPRISLYQTHPFTIVSNGPFGLELVIKSRDGFTKNLSDLAAHRPFSARWASIDGPYGSLPDTTVYEKLVLVAGGSGAAFTFGLMNRIRSHPEQVSAQSIDFLWAVKHAGQVSWFLKHLLNITSTESVVNVTIYVTDGEPVTRLDCDSAENQSVVRDLHERNSTESGVVSEIGEMQSLLASTPRKDLEHLVTFRHSRMSTEATIYEAMQTVGSGDRVLVAVCGPDSLTEALRGSVENYQSKHSCRIDLHCEEFNG